MIELLDEIERRLAGIQSTTEILLAVRIMQDGHASTMREALAIARNPFILNKLYPEPAAPDPFYPTGTAW